MRSLIGGVGYPDLADHSLGWAVLDALARQPLPEHVVAEDASYNPVALAQRLDAEPSDRRFSRVVLVGAVGRDRPAGAMVAYRWDRVLPVPDEIQRAVGEAVTGIISLDNTLVVLQQLGALPGEVAVVEVEPRVEAFGASLSEEVAAIFPRVCELVVSLAGDDRAFAALTVAPLGGAKAPR